MRAVQILFVALLLGSLGGYLWSRMSAPQAHAAASHRTMIAVPPSPEETPLDSDREWSARATDKGPILVQRAPDPTLVERSVSYAGCNEVRAAGKAPLYAGQPGYREDMDGDGDGVACEPHRAR